jgi:hypothetical protein
MAQFAVLYAPSITGGSTSNTTQTGSFYIGRLIQGRVWNQIITTSNGEAYFWASPDDASAYIIALPFNTGVSPAGYEIPPQFFYSLASNGSPSKTDAAFINTCSYILKNYSNDGSIGTPKINSLGCSTVNDCRNQINTVGWQSYGFTAP